MVPEGIWLPEFQFHGAKEGFWLPNPSSCWSKTFGHLLPLARSSPAKTIWIYGFSSFLSHSWIFPLFGNIPLATESKPCWIYGFFSFLSHSWPFPLFGNIPLPMESSWNGWVGREPKDDPKLLQAPSNLDLDIPGMEQPWFFQGSKEILPLKVQDPFPSNLSERKNSIQTPPFPPSLIPSPPSSHSWITTKKSWKQKVMEQSVQKRNSKCKSSWKTEKSKDFPDSRSKEASPPTLNGFREQKWIKIRINPIPRAGNASNPLHSRCDGSEDEGIVVIPRNLLHPSGEVFGEGGIPQIPLCYSNRTRFWAENETAP